jgi:hypothetical protein
MAVKTSPRPVKAAGAARRKNGQAARPTGIAQSKAAASMTVPTARRQKAGDSGQRSRKYLSPAMLAALIRESPTPAVANRGPAKPPFELQEN